MCAVAFVAWGDASDAGHDGAPDGRDAHADAADGPDAVDAAVEVEAEAETDAGAETETETESDAPSDAGGPSGTLDGSFGTSGVVRLSPTTAGPDELRAVAIDASDRIVACGVAGRSIHVVRLLADGTLDSTFGTGGAVVTTVADSGGAALTSHCNGVAVQADGKIVAAGTVNRTGQSSSPAGRRPASPIVPWSSASTASASRTRRSERRACR